MQTENQTLVINEKKYTYDDKHRMKTIFEGDFFNRSLGKVCMLTEYEYFNKKSKVIKKFATDENGNKLFCREFIKFDEDGKTVVCCYDSIVTYHFYDVSLFELKKLTTLNKKTDEEYKKKITKFFKYLPKAINEDTFDEVLISFYPSDVIKINREDIYEYKDIKNTSCIDIVIVSKCKNNMEIDFDFDKSKFDSFKEKELITRIEKQKSMEVDHYRLSCDFEHQEILMCIDYYGKSLSDLFSTNKKYLNPLSNMQKDLCSHISKYLCKTKFKFDAESEQILYDEIKNGKGSVIYFIKGFKSLIQESIDVDLPKAFNTLTADKYSYQKIKYLNKEFLYMHSSQSCEFRNDSSILNDKIRCTYTKSDKLVKEKMEPKYTFDYIITNGNKSGTWSLSYDKEGSLTDSVTFKSLKSLEITDNPYEHYKYRYTNENEYTIDYWLSDSTTSMKKPKISMKTVFKLFDKDHIKECTVYKNNKKESFTKYEYDDNLNILKVEEYMYI